MVELVHYFLVPDTPQRAQHGIDFVENGHGASDTSSDIESGLRAGAAVVAGALTGAHDEQRLRSAGATHVLESVTEFADLILQIRNEVKP
ncbi:hypothetical protein ACGFK1_26355 [Mycobacterium sp. NPDC048908]|uniref:hypothetical protein n=1 Tax=Mycobacterium sp. NPDC048908 TaxID=3364292 RepID=UPI00371E05AA